MRRLENRVALITGGNRGIGRAASLIFAEEGAKVAVAARGREEGDAVVETIRAGGGSAMFIQTDVSVAADCRNAVSETVKAFGKLDVAFNNAGVEQFGTNIAALEEDEWARVLAINLTGVFLCMKYEIPEMLNAGGGSIINTSSVAGLIGSFGQAAYNASKHGVIGLTKSAALDVAKQNIRVNALCPGGTCSEMFTRWLKVPGVRERVLARHPIGRFAEPSETARAALFLASADSSFITGVALPVDGGLVVP
jgi:NAD(P)-dependent dehydrogenase (short-subunit alcohol dehydrogenase family)